MSRANPTGHPARFSEEIVDALVDIINSEVTEWFNPPVLHDPFAGTGEALAEIAERCQPGGFGPLPYSGTELEPEWIVDHHVIHGDATDYRTYPPYRVAHGTMEGNGRFIIVTSPAYPNGMADAWKATDDSERNTYQWRLDKLRGKHVEMHRNNQARLGYRGTKRGGKSSKREAYWRVAREAVECWMSADMLLVNVSDFKHGNGQTEPLVTDWRCLLKEFGWHDQTEIHVGTRRNGNGSNADQRVEHETIIVAKR